MFIGSSLILIAFCPDGSLKTIGVVELELFVIRQKTQDSHTNKQLANILYVLFVKNEDSRKEAKKTQSSFFLQFDFTRQSVNVVLRLCYSRIPLI